MPMNAQELLQQVVARYASLLSYADSGTVRQPLKAVEPPLVTTFATLFRRPACLRCQFDVPHAYPPLRHIVRRHIVVADGSNVHTLRGEAGRPLQLETKASLALAVAGATGVSHGSAQHIARLLLPQEVGGLSMLDLVEAQMEPETSLGPIDCYQVAARHPRFGGLLEFCIEKDTLLVRRTRTYHTDRGDPDEEAREGIRVNEPLDDSLFQPDVDAQRPAAN